MASTGTTTLTRRHRQPDYGQGFHLRIQTQWYSEITIRLGFRLDFT
jgi:hypothetical protein